eukprot:10472727-Alexandrium_andersonii.AAC.1
MLTSESYMDDTVIVVEDPTPEGLFEKIRIALAAAMQVYAAHGHNVNFRPGKTELVLKVVGGSAAQCWKDNVQCVEGRPSVIGHGGVACAVVPVYTHLGLQFSRSHSASPDANKRVAASRAALASLSKHVFHNHAASKAVRLKFVRAFIVSRL